MEARTFTEWGNKAKADSELMMSKVGEIANIIANSVGKTKGEMVLEMTRAAFPPGHPEILFAEWMAANQGRIREAIAELGIEEPEPGPGLYQRLKDAVMPVLVGNPHMGKVRL